MYMNVLRVCMYVCIMCPGLLPTEVGKEHRIPLITTAMNGGELLYGFWEPNFGVLQEQQCVLKCSEDC